MAIFHFPLLFWVPSTSDDVSRAHFKLTGRKWDVSIFDLYSLAAEGHQMRMPVELMQVFLPRVNLEIAVEAEEHSAACRQLDILRAMLYSRGLAPTLAPFATNYSLNAYAGINGRSSDLTKDKLHKGLQTGINLKDAKVEGWPYELSLMCLRGDPEQLSNTVSEDVFLSAVQDSLLWRNLEDKNPPAKVIRAALAKAPLMPDISSSILHMWQALENIIRIQSEITYRTSLLLAELCAPIQPRSLTYDTAKKSYGDRSKIAHGSSSSVDIFQWMRAWGLLQKTCQAILLRGGIPSADELTRELLAH
ncbi:hypothetical protein OFL65_08665 [Pseudomonas aeruginosa]|uniref:hypothetical protein n=1 Tax=Pseudomonas aeruginosa TaxID=287 RepID=UPI001FCD566A|nr:hypothetical protein [Pseudomonas aeruginosa]MCV6579201.1 hypothetical protein [Pseudomonas aeruginosa]